MADLKPNDELDWVKIHEDLNNTYITETFFQKAIRKTRENPLVPIGTLATITALSIGLISFYKGKREMQQYMMRARVGAQAFTIVCMVVGFIMIPKSK
ncbi:PREDICTED: HIG1 domain family member 2A, mitochondrial [Atta cephalotes]|uniref:HIG1 domain-containing protein n=2 Tax=Atta TaxID=12956 RepID=A0A158NIX3_ATTCE|nr:PREDICTED: HIG1 domain family member 2A, mitochondrial [Atta cephalotes]XP_018053064.1 PREDICTED: HIG1 domain family member 2A, mitochondrial [Atta colombica]KYM79276.1 HIG1 domain family member 2A [Atta colombica]